MKLLQATKDDLTGVSLLFNQYRMFYNQLDDMNGAKSYIRERLQQGDSIIFVMKEGDTYLGFTQLYPTFSSISMKKAWILNDLYVHEEARGKGVAESLLNRAKAFALETEAVSIALSTAPDNLPAQQLYEKIGYERDEKFYHYELNLV
ncbi:GNAT family N-acetyltransferase [Alkalihalobacillus sp. LMS6]|uniref:GNAT family N-acetyltransferase n=1 Tax=Alkalihalobacillus sp. LMS6 TaxID=2924034 RepID=UPI0020D1EED8|nr:GNAT family N-acetyltransferase [Alkalihalobacillus sp. LMS6]UTR06785.1 GNAT family N-acetyltransferase [Alkalihalobacillus sp. LMS6]